MTSYFGFNFVKPFYPRHYVNLSSSSPHHLRHTAATNLKDLGIAPKDAQMILGHAHISTTLQIYQHSNMSGRSEALKKYELQIAEKSTISRQVKPSNEKAIVKNNDSYSGTPDRI